MIIQNAIMIVEDWPEVSFLVSSHVHDFKTHTFHNGMSVSVDGGHDYIRRCYPPKLAGYGTKYMEFNLDDTEPFHTIKHRLLWGTRGLDGHQPLKWVRLMDCTSDHLQAILDYPYPTNKRLSSLYKKVIKDILAKDKHVMYKSNICKRKVAWITPKFYIHKAFRPKHQFMNPTLCVANLSDQDSHRLSRIRWTNVTCPACLSKRIHNDF
jgi:hypothetical protein